MNLFLKKWRLLTAIYGYHTGDAQEFIRHRICTQYASITIWWREKPFTWERRDLWRGIGTKITQNRREAHVFLGEGREKNLDMFLLRKSNFMMINEFRYGITWKLWPSPLSLSLYSTFNFIFMLKSRGFLLGLKIISSVFETFNEILLALSQFVRLFRSVFKSLFNLLSDLLMIRRSVSSAEWWTLECFIATCRSLIYSRKTKGPETDPCGTPHVILQVLMQSHWLIQIAYGLLNMIQTISLLIYIFHSDTMCSTECYDLQYQKPSKGQQKYHMQSYHHQERLLFP